MPMIDLSNSQGVEFKGGTFTQINNNFVQKSTPWECLQSATDSSAFHNSGRGPDAPNSFPNDIVAVMNETRDCVSQGDDIGHPKVISLSGSKIDVRSAIARSLCEGYSVDGFLLASFFFCQSDNPDWFVATIAYQICVNLPKDYRHYILDVVENDPLIFTKSIKTQFNDLIITPIQKLVKNECFDLGSRRLIVIDDLDGFLPAMAYADILAMIQNATKQRLIPFIFVITSDSKDAIQKCFESSDSRSLLHQIDLPTSQPLNSDSTLSDRSWDDDAASTYSEFTDPLSLRDDEWDIAPTFPREQLEYERKTSLKSMKPDFSFKPFATPRGWTSYNRPDGSRYFYNKSKKICTEAEIRDSEQLRLVERMIKKVEMHKKSLPADALANFDTVLYIRGGANGSEDCHYYCVDHMARVVFFFHEKGTDSWGEGDFSQSQIRDGLEFEYWHAVQMYRHSLTLSADIIKELRDIELYSMGGDATTWPYYTSYTSEYTFENIQNILSTTLYGKENIISEQTSGTMCLLAQFMLMLNHGESYNEIKRKLSVYGDSRFIPRSSRQSPLSLFPDSDFNLHGWQKLRADKVLGEAVWKEILKLHLGATTNPPHICRYIRDCKICNLVNESTPPGKVIGEKYVLPVGYGTYWWFNTRTSTPGTTLG